MAWWLFQHVVITAALVLIVAGVCRVARPGPVVRHALWLIVLVKFVTPPLLVWPWLAPDPLRMSALDAASDAPAWVPGDLDDDGASAAASRADGGRVDAIESAALPAGAETLVAAAAADAIAAAWPWLLAIWVAGGIVLAAIEAGRLITLRRLVRRGQAAPPEIVERVAALSARLHLNPVPVRAIPGGGPPAVWSLGRPQLLWPEDLDAAMSDACLDGVLLHELAHVKRRDHLVGWIELAAGVVWWWNPLFWFVRAARREQAELACDAWVISLLPHGRRAYAESLLALSISPVPDPRSMVAVGVHATSRRQLERRLVMIMQGRVPLRLTRVGLFTLVGIAAATAPGWTAGAQAPVVAATQSISTPVQTVAVTPPQTATVPRAPHVERVAPARTRPARQPQRTVRSVEVQTPAPRARTQMRVHLSSKLPADGDALLKDFSTDRETMEREFDQRVAARRAELIKSLEALQERLTKEGRLDDAIAVRDYIRSGLPGVDSRLMIRGSSSGR